MKDADEVLALRRIDAGLAADGAIDLSQERRRDLHEADAATEDARREARKVANDAAAERHDEVAAFEAKFQKAFRKDCQIAEAFCPFARRHHDRTGEQSFRFEAVFERCKMVPGDVLVGHDPTFHGAEPRFDEGAGVGQQPARDQNVVRAVAKLDAHAARRTGRLHRACRHRGTGREAVYDFVDGQIVRLVSAFNGHIGLGIDRITGFNQLAHRGFGIAFAQ